VFTAEKIALDCPCCGETIYRPLAWFRLTYSTCPQCGGGLTAGQFEAALEEIEKAFDTRIEEQIRGESPGCNCGGCR
jgi:hypothetical protein